MAPKKPARIAERKSKDIRSFFRPPQATPPSSSPIATQPTPESTDEPSNPRRHNASQEKELGSAVSDTSTEPKLSMDRPGSRVTVSPASTLEALPPNRSPTSPGEGPGLTNAIMNTEVLVAVHSTGFEDVECDSSTGLELSADSPRTRSTIPFAPPTPYSCVCPFKAPNGDCKTAPFKDLRGLAAHCSQKHPGQILIPFDNDSIQDGTKRIPCLKNCGRNFATYDAAMQHVKKCDAPDTPRHCPWPDCNYPPSKAREYAAHTVVHIDDARGKYQCDKCPRYWNDLYLLAGHRMRCKGEGGKSRADRENRFQSIHDPAETDEGLTFLVAVARASGAAPKAWKGDEDPVQDGIDTFASPIFDTFQTDHGVAQGSVCGTFLAMDNIHTSVTPTAKDVMLHNIADPVLRQYITQAYVFTRAIDKDLEALASRNVKPVLLSIGIDGFSCNTKLILPWLQRSPRFTLVIRETDLPYGMDEAYFPQYESGFYYGIFDSAEILEQLSVDMSADMSGDNAISNLLAAWNALQAWKDTSPVRSRGRNGQPNEFGSKKKQRVRERE